MTRFDAEDLRKLAAASAAVLGSVARDSARQLVDRRRERKAQERSPVPGVATTPRRRRFKRRWVVVPVLVAVLITIAVLSGATMLLLWFLGQL